MNILSVAGKLASNRPPVELDANRCVRANDRLSECDRCVRACPVDAIRLDAPIALDQETCVACGLCLRLCPVGAYTGDAERGAADLFDLLARLPATPRVELVCARHPTPAQGNFADAVVIRANTCLAAFGPSRYLQLATWLCLKCGTVISQVVARMDACAECALGRVQPEIARAVDAAQAVLSARGETDRVIGIVEKPGADSRSRPVYDTKNPPVSRRDLLRLFAVEGTRAANRIMASDNDQPVGKTPPPEQRRLLGALKQLAPLESAEWQNAPTRNLGLARLDVDEKCAACGVCARVCPTGAMRFTTTENTQYRLTLLLSQCTDCGVCIDLCEPSALQRGDAPTYAEFIAAEPAVLKAGGLKQCNRCHASFADHLAGNLCPTCQYRMENPFGRRMPKVAQRRAQ